MVGLCLEKRVFFILVVEREETDGLVKTEVKREGRRAGPERSGGGRSETRTVYNTLSFRPDDLHLTPPSLLISRNGVENRSQRPQINWQVSPRFIPPVSSMSCNFLNSWQGQTPGLSRCRLKIPIVCPGCIACDIPTHADFTPYRRGMSSQPPAEKASEIINKLPSSPSLVTKTGSVILGSGLVATAISQELYVMNEETVIAVGFFLLIGFIAKARI